MPNIEALPTVENGKILGMHCAAATLRNSRHVLGCGERKRRRKKKKKRERKRKKKRK
jgi:hypothetical protein